MNTDHPRGMAWLKENVDALVMALAVLGLAVALEIEWWRAFLLMASICVLFAVAVRILASGVRISVTLKHRPPPDDEDDPDEDEVDEEPLPPTTPERPRPTVFN